MGIDTICNAINKAIDAARAPLANIPAILLLCSALKRPGLSAMMIAANVIRRQAEAGAPFGPGRGGFKNIMEAMERVRAEEYIKAIKMDMKVETAMPIGGMKIMGTGSNAGGPVVINGFNINFAHSAGIGR